jgi:hypothetical protein
MKNSNNIADTKTNNALAVAAKQQQQHWLIFVTTLAFTLFIYYIVHTYFPLISDLFILSTLITLGILSVLSFIVYLLLYLYFLISYNPDLFSTSSAKAPPSLQCSEGEAAASAFLASVYAREETLSLREREKSLPKYLPKEIKNGVLTFSNSPNKASFIKFILKLILLNISLILFGLIYLLFIISFY